jgi:asparagine synthase (glutamine-hydrolysing)
LDYIFSRQENFNEETFFQGIYSFLPSSLCTLDLNNKNPSIKFDKYYDLEDAVKKRIESDIQPCNEEIIFHLRNSIKLRLRSDVPNGILLSGGIDSSSIAIACQEMIQEHKSRLHYFHAKSFQKSNDESDMAKALAGHLRVPLDISEPSQKDFLGMFDALAISQDEPFGGPSMLMGFSIYEYAKNKGIKVMLGGQGADEILFGYERYIASLGSLLNPLAFSSIIQSGKQHSLSILSSLMHLIYFRYYPIRYYRLRKNTFIKKEYVQNMNMETLKNTVKSFKTKHLVQISEVNTYQLPHLLRYEDRNSMAHSIESRLPFLESNLVELSLSMPINFKNDNGWSKKVLRDFLSQSGAQRQAWSRKKIGFEAPEEFWRKDKKEMIIKEILNSSILNKYCNLDQFIKSFDVLSLHEIWPYFSVATWERVFNVEI